MRRSLVTSQQLHVTLVAVEAVAGAGTTAVESACSCLLILTQGVDRCGRAVNKEKIPLVLVAVPETRDEVEAQKRIDITSLGGALVAGRERHLRTAVVVRRQELFLGDKGVGALEAGHDEGRHEHERLNQFVHSDPLARLEAPTPLQQRLSVSAGMLAVMGKLKDWTIYKSY